MSHRITPLEDPITYQIVVTALPAADNSKPPSYCADVKRDKKGKVVTKPYSPKNLSKDLFLDLQILANVLLAPISPKIYLAGMFMGIAKPIYDWQTKNIVPQPKKLINDTNQNDFGKMSRSNKLSYFVIGMLGPVAVASAIQERYPLFSQAIVGLGGLNFCHQLTQRVIRWIN